ncbi:hypothetical protein HNQ10_000643 [Deinococcus metallilatus]|uniref:Uncharacterized protein n=1 Tax=Deinococcus metallilatus TaxID=1211322 RepID=A0ABR6MR59_9DEIO|nr:hypothetical protein [Deinococcus metallilatus]
MPTIPAGRNETRPVPWATGRRSDPADPGQRPSDLRRPERCDPCPSRPAGPSPGGVTRGHDRAAASGADDLPGRRTLPPRRDRLARGAAVQAALRTSRVAALLPQPQAGRGPGGGPAAHQPRPLRGGRPTAAAVPGRRDRMGKGRPSRPTWPDPTSCCPPWTGNSPCRSS